MQTISYEGIVTALTSISHNGGEANGNIMSFRREKRVQPDGRVADVPIFSGNAMRGILRDAGMLFMLRQLGYGYDEETDTVKGIPLERFYFLFSGGSLTSTGEVGVNVDAFRKLRKTLPLISLFGGASGNGIMPGKLSIGMLTPICRETAHLLPEWCYQDTLLLSCYDLCQLQTYTRRDDAKNDLLLEMLNKKSIDAPVQTKAVETKKKPVAASLSLFGEPDSDTEVEEIETSPVKLEKEKKSAPQQMIYSVETLAAGTRFHWPITIQDPTKVELEAFQSAILAFAYRPFIGGKSAVGHGKVSIKMNHSININPLGNTLGDELEMKPGQIYQKFLDENGDSIREYLDSIIK